MKSLLDDGLKMAITFVVIAILARWGWTIFRPFAPWLVVGGVGFLALRYGVHRYRGW